MRVPRLMIGLAMAVWIVSVAETAHASPFTLQTVPLNGAISGGAGSTVGWGYLIANPSATDWLVLAGVSAGVFQHATPNAAVFDFPILAPMATIMAPYVTGAAGLFELTWDVNAPVGFVNSGVFTVSAEWWSDDPFAGGQFLQLATDQFASYGATVTPAASVPELSSLTLLSGACFAGWCRRRLKQRQANGTRQT